MNDPRSDRAPRDARPGPDDEMGWLGLMLGLHPFAALVVDLDSAAVVLANRAARAGPLVLAREPREADGVHAELGGVPVAARDLVRRLAAPASAEDGVELTWNVPGREYRFRAFCRSLPPARGRPVLAMLTFLDVTEQRAGEVELRRALEVRDEFFSIATHELKDPLFSLQLSGQLLRHRATRQGELPAHLHDHLEVERRQTDRLARLIDNLLDVSRILNGRLGLDLEALDLSELVDEAVERFRDRAEAAGTPLAAEPCGPVIGYFDRLKIEQVVGNLLANALKYGDGRPVAVRVRADEEAAVIEVEDRGPGIAPEEQARIFGRFERASGDHRKESLGLGLYIVRSLVEAHGGSVGVRSEPGRGATFVVALPRRRLPADADLSADGDATGTDQGGPDGP